MDKENKEKSTFSDRVKKFLVKPDKDLQSLIEEYKTGVQYHGSVQNQRSTNTLTSLREVPSMVQDPIISSCLAVIMESAFQAGENGETYRVVTQYKSIEKELVKFHESVNMYQQIISTAYNLLLWGNLPYKHLFDDEGKLTRVIPIPDFTKVTPIKVSGRVIGYMVDSEFYFTYEYSYAQLNYFNDFGGMLSTGLFPTSNLGKDESISNEFIISPSYLSSSVQPWKSVRTIEDALMLNRMDQSNYYRVISVDVGSQVFSKNAIAVLNYYRNIFKKVRRISYNSDGMNSIGNHQEFEVIVPKSGNNDVQFHDVGGGIEVKALKDLDLMYQKLFASLRVNPSMIGYSEKIPSSLGDSPALLWDKRLNRTVKMLLFSTFAWLKEVDYVYLRSRGYDVNRNDWQYKTHSISLIEDKEKAEILETSIQNLDSIGTLLDNINVDFNKEYLVKRVLGNVLESIGVNMDELLEKTDEEKKVITSTGINYLKEVDMMSSWNSLVELGVIKGDIEHVGKPKVKIASNRVPYEYLKSCEGMYPKNSVVSFSGGVEVIDSIPDKEKFEVSNLVTCSVQKRVYYFPSSGDVKNLTVQDVEDGGIRIVNNVISDKLGRLIFTNSEDLSNYLYIKSSGLTSFVVQDFIEEI